MKCNCGFAHFLDLFPDGCDIEATHFLIFNQDTVLVCKAHFAEYQAVFRRCAPEFDDVHSGNIRLENITSTAPAKELPK